VVLATGRSLTVPDVDGELDRLFEHSALCGEVALVDVSGTYADQKTEVVNIIKRGILPTLMPGDSLCGIRIDYRSYQQQNLEADLTPDQAADMLLALEPALAGLPPVPLMRAAPLGSNGSRVSPDANPDPFGPSGLHGWPGQGTVLRYRDRGGTPEELSAAPEDTGFRPSGTAAAFTGHRPQRSPLRSRRVVLTVAAVVAVLGAAEDDPVQRVERDRHDGGVGHRDVGADGERDQAPAGEALHRCRRRRVRLHARRRRHDHDR